jgi:hypothetical protein
MAVNSNIPTAPSGDGVNQIPKGGEQKSIKCPTYAQPPPPPLGLTLIGALQNH